MKQLRTALIGLSLIALMPEARAALPATLLQDEQTGEEKPDKRPELKELLDAFGEHIGARGDEDLDAIKLIDKLVTEEWGKSGPKDRKSILDALDDVFKVKRKDTPEGGRDNKLFVACAVALGEMGPDSSKTITGWIDHKSHRDDLVLQRALLLSLGKTKDEKAAQELMDALLNKHAELVAAAAEALAFYGESPSKMRKEIFEEVLKIFGSAKVSVDQDPNDTIARDRYDKIEASMITTLQSMTGQELRDPYEWQSWWNDNKKRDWDEES